MSDPDVPPERSPRLFYGYIIVAVACAALIILFGAFVSFGVFLKPVSADFGWSRGSISLAAGLCWITQSVGALIMGKLCDSRGPRFTMTICGLAVGAGFLLMSGLNSLWQLYLYYGVLNGIGFSAAFVSLTPTIARWFVIRRSLMSGIQMAGAGIGGLVMPIVANKLINTFDWRTSYLIMGIIVIVGVVLLAQFLRRDPAQMGLYPDNHRPEHTVARREHAPASFTLSQAVRTWQYWAVMVILLSLGYCINTIQVHIVPHATDLGISDTTAVVLLSLMSGTGIVGAILMGQRADKTGVRKTFLLCYVLVLLCFIWLIPAGAYWQLLLFTIVLGFFINGNIALQSPLAAEYFGVGSLGTVLGSLTIGFSIGAAGGSYIPGFIFDATGSYIAAFIVCGVLALVTVILLAILKPMRAARLTAVAR